MGYTVQDFGWVHLRIVRTGPEHEETGDDWEVCVAVTTKDEKTGEVWGLSPEAKFRPTHYKDLRTAITTEGLIPEWYQSNGRNLPMTKRTIPHPDNVTNHDEVAKMAVEQILQGHYRVENVRDVKQFDHSDHHKTITLTFDRFEVDPAVPAES